MIGAVVQARMGSTRLPGKVLLRVKGRPLLAYLLERLSFCRMLDQIVVATSADERDDAIAAFCKESGTTVFRGSERDVLDRYYQAAQSFCFDVVVRVTADCPLIDPLLVDQMIRFYLDHRDQYDLVTNRHPLTFPDGLDADVMPAEALKFAWRNAHKPHQREHTIPFFWETGMRVHNFEDRANLFALHRWTLDYPEDFELIKAILDNLYRTGNLFTTQDILAFLANNPEYRNINSKYIPAA